MGSEPRSVTHWASMAVEALDLTVRAHNCLQREGIRTVGELVKKTPDELLSIRAMGRTTVRVIQKTLAARGLHLGMQEIDLRACQSLDAFLQAVDRVRGHGVLRLADLVGKTPQEVAALPGVDAEVVRHLEDGLAQWGLTLGTWSVRKSTSDRASASDSSTLREVTAIPNRPHGVTAERASERTSEKLSVQRDDSQTIKDELLHVMEYLLADRESNWFRCFATYHGVDGRGRQTLQAIGDRGPAYGFGTPVTRERVRQVVTEAQLLLRRRADRIDIANWTRAVLHARERTPASIECVVDAFGYRSCDEPADVFSMLRLAADIFSLEFPFDVETIRGTDVVTDGGAACVETMNVVRELTAVDNDSYFDTARTAETIGCEAVTLEKVVSGPFGWEFLDEAHRYFWMPPPLPPRNYAITGNAILTGLCKVFSVAREATTIDLAQAVSRHRGVRKTVPRDVIEGIAMRSGLFDLEDGVLRRKAGQAWFCLGNRELRLLRVCVEHGRVVSSQTLHSSLVRYGLTSENAGIVVAYSPLLVHTKAGQFRDEGIYKLVCRTDDVVMAPREDGQEGNGRTEQQYPNAGESEGTVLIPVSPRVRLSGSHFAAEPLNMDGEWHVVGIDGTVIGTVTLSDRLVEGLCQVIDALDLEMNAVLELRRYGNGNLLAVRA